LYHDFTVSGLRPSVSARVERPPTLLSMAPWRFIAIYCGARSPMVKPQANEA
jgi:hypothetical protein